MSQDVENGEAGQGGADEGSSPSEQTVPLSVLLAERGKFEDRMATKVAELEGKISAAATKPKEVTRAELQVAVDDGRMTPDESDRIIEKQMKDNITSDIRTDLSNERKTSEATDRVNSEIALYTNSRPNIMVEGTEDRNLVAAEYDRQRKILGRPDNAETELNALMTVFGSSSRLQTARSKGAETHQETGSDGGGNESSSSDGWPKEMSLGHRAFYQDQINKNIIPDKKAAIEKFSYKPQHNKRRA